MCCNVPLIDYPSVGDDPSSGVPSSNQQTDSLPRRYYRNHFTLSLLGLVPEEEISVPQDDESDESDTWTVGVLNEDESWSLVNDESESEEDLSESEDEDGNGEDYDEEDILLAQISQRNARERRAQARNATQSGENDEIDDEDRPMWDSDMELEE